MAAALQPVFTVKANCPTAVVAAANTASDGSGVLVDLFTAGADGSWVDYITVINAQLAAAASSAMVVRVFLTDSSGNNPRLIEERALPAATRTASVIGARVDIGINRGLVSGQKIKVCQSVYAGAADQNHFSAVGQDFS